MNKFTLACLVGLAASISVKEDGPGPQGPAGHDGPGEDFRPTPEECEIGGAALEGLDEETADWDAIKARLPADWTATEDEFWTAAAWCWDQEEGDDETDGEGDDDTDGEGDDDTDGEGDDDTDGEWDDADGEWDDAEGEWDGDDAEWDDADGEWDDADAEWDGDDADYDDQEWEAGPCDDLETAALEACGSDPYEQRYDIEDDAE